MSDGGVGVHRATAAHEHPMAEQGDAQRMLCPHGKPTLEEGQSVRSPTPEEEGAQ